MRGSPPGFRSRIEQLKGSFAPALCVEAEQALVSVGEGDLHIPSADDAGRLSLTHSEAHLRDQHQYHPTRSRNHTHAPGWNPKYQNPIQLQICRTAQPDATAKFAVPVSPIHRFPPSPRLRRAGWDSG